MAGRAEQTPFADQTFDALTFTYLLRYVADPGATVFMSNHSEFDNSVMKIKAIAARKPGEPHPFELGRDAIQRYFKVSDECAQVSKLKLQAQAAAKAN